MLSFYQKTAVLDSLAAARDLESRPASAPPSLFLSSPLKSVLLPLSVRHQGRDSKALASRIKTVETPSVYPISSIFSISFHSHPQTIHTSTSGNCLKSFWFNFSLTAHVRHTYGTRPDSRSTLFQYTSTHTGHTPDTCHKWIWTRLH